MTKLFPWLARTGQLWKMRVALALMGLTGLSFVGFIWAMNSQEGAEKDLLFALAFVGVGTLWFLVMAFAFRCPGCNCAASFTLMRTEGHDEWWPALMQLSRCPRCKLEL
jgi:fatty acid desaturase